MMIQSVGRLKRFMPLFAVFLLGVGAAVSCSDQQAPTSLTGMRPSDNASYVMLPPVYVTAPAPVFCYQDGFLWKCDNAEYGAGGKYLGVLGQQPQITEYCNGPQTIVFCRFDGGLGGGTRTGIYNGDNPMLDEAEAADPFDALSVEEIPDCAHLPANANKKDIVWCNAKRLEQLTEIQRTRLNDAVDAMAAMPDADCQRLAGSLRTVMAAGNMRIYPAAALTEGNQSTAGFSGSDPDAQKAYIGISDAMLNNAFDKFHQTRTTEPIFLQLTLAHEADHLWVEQHIPGSRAYTPHSKTCGGL